MKNGNTLEYFASYCLWKQAFDTNSPQTTPNLICLIFLGTKVLSQCLNLKLGKLSAEENPKTCLIL